MALSTARGFEVWKPEMIIWDVSAFVKEGCIKVSVDCIVGRKEINMECSPVDILINSYKRMSLITYIGSSGNMEYHFLFPSYLS